MAPKRKLCLPSSSESDEDFYFQAKRAKDEVHEIPKDHVKDPREDDEDDIQAVNDHGGEEEDDDTEEEEELKGHQEAKQKPREIACCVRTVRKFPRETLNEKRKGSGVLVTKCSSKKLWSDDEESTILKGMLDFKSKGGGSDAHSRLSELALACPHLKNLYLLSKKVWGNVKGFDVDEQEEEEEKKEATEMGKLPDEVADSEETVKDVAEEVRNFWFVYPRLNESLKLEEFSGCTLPVSGADAMKENLSSIGKSKAAELEDKWRKLQVAETEVKLMRATLIQEQTKLILDLM